jgi:glutathione S-transferase
VSHRLAWGHPSRCARSIEFQRKTTRGALPGFELGDGTCIAECTAITEYLDALGGAPTLTGTTPLGKGVIRMMSKRAELELLDPISVYFHHATPGLGPEVELSSSRRRAKHSIRAIPSVSARRRRFRPQPIRLTATAVESVGASRR